MTTSSNAPTDDVRAEAIEAAYEALAWTEGDIIPHLLAPIRALVVTYRFSGSEDVDRVLDALTDALDQIEGGRDERA